MPHFLLCLTTFRLCLIQTPPPRPPRRGRSDLAFSAFDLNPLSSLSAHIYVRISLSSILYPSPFIPLPAFCLPVSPPSFLPSFTFCPLLLLLLLASLSPSVPAPFLTSLLSYPHPSSPITYLSSLSSSYVRVCLILSSFQLLFLPYTILLWGVFDFSILP